MDRVDSIEKIWGGIFGAIAIVAAIVEMIVNGISASSIIAAVKDVFGTLVVIALLLAVLKDRIPKRTFEQRLSVALEKWQKENSNMIIRDERYDKGANNTTFYSFGMKTNVADFYEKGGSTHKTGLFVRMPELKRENYAGGKVELLFSLNKGTFFPDVPAEEVTNGHYETLAENFAKLINAKHSDFAEASVSNPKELLVTVKKAVKSHTDIENLVDVLNTTYTAYLVSARFSQKS